MCEGASKPKIIQHHLVLKILDPALTVSQIRLLRKYLFLTFSDAAEANLVAPSANDDQP